MKRCHVCKLHMDLFAKDDELCPHYGSNLPGFQYYAYCGPYQGQIITVIGPDPMLPGKDYWLVETENGDHWGTRGEPIRKMLN